MIHILVVEDDEKLNQIICAYLCRNNYQAKGCKNPVEAYDLLYSEVFDLIISDIMMPQVNGFDFAKEIREKNPTILILFITALDDLSSKQKGFYAGIDDYMVKPIDTDEMVLRVGALLRRSKVNNDNRLEIGSLLLIRDEMTAYGGGVFGVSMIILYLASSVYHGTAPQDAEEKRIFRILDHCSIFVLIAGTCSPFILNLIDNQSVYTEWVFYALFWLFAIGGIALLCADMKKYKSIAVVLYVLMGFALITHIDSFIQYIGETGTWLLLAGGVVYLIGLLFYGLGTRAFRF